MDLKDFLEENRLINVAELARLMYPTNKNPKSRLFNKLTEKYAGTGKQRITDSDKEKALYVFKDLVRKLNEFIDGNKNLDK